MSRPTLQQMANDIGKRMNDIREMFTGHVEVSVIIRRPSEDDHSQDVFLTNDDPEKIKETIDFFANPPEEGRCNVLGSL